MSFSGNKVFEKIIYYTIILNLIAMVIESEPDLDSKLREFLYWFEVGSISIFSFEYIVRKKIQRQNKFITYTTHTPWVDSSVCDDRTPNIKAGGCKIGNPNKVFYKQAKNLRDLVDKLESLSDVDELAGVLFDTFVSKDIPFLNHNLDVDILHFKACPKSWIVAKKFFHTIAVCNLALVSHHGKPTAGPAAPRIIIVRAIC